jgi:flavorubredoxin
MGYLNAIEISRGVYWVGAIDWSIRNFHGYATDAGSTYNAFLIVADKITLIDTVKSQYKDEMLARIASVIDVDEIDYIVSNHAEMDHSGALPYFISLAKPEKVFASKMGVKALTAHFGIDFPITAVGTGDELDLGGMTLSFIETRMLHWPDSMFTYLKESKIIFTQDAFGMHLASSFIFADQNPSETIRWESEKYYANILMPYSGKVSALLDSIAEMELELDMIATDHGPIWRRPEDIAKILDWYREWSEQAPTMKAVIIYDTMWGATCKMSASIADGLRSVGADVKVLPLSGSDRSEVVTEVLASGALIVGSPPINNQIFQTLADVLTYIKGLRPKNLIGAAFGSYGWSGEAVKQLNQYFQDMSVDLVSDGIKVLYTPTDEDLERCFQLGVDIGVELKKRVTVNA